MNNSIREQLFALSEPKYKTFSSNLLPEIPNSQIIGVRLPLLRKIAKIIARSNYEEYFHTAYCEYFEEIMLQGMVIGYLQLDLDSVLNYISNFIPKINNWSVCDSFCSGLKITKNNQEKMWQYIQPYFKSKEPFAVRFAIVMLIFYYINDTYLHKVLKLLDTISLDNYYVKMAVAWSISIYYNSYPNEVLSYISNNNLDTFTYNKALQKILESKIPTKTQKDIIRKMKR